MPVVLGVAAVAALLLVAEAASGRDFYLASGLVLAAWTFAALLWFIACYRGGQAQTEDSLFEASDADAAPEDNAPPDDESSPYHRGTGPELNELGPYEGRWEFDGNDELADSEEWDDSFSGEFEPDDDLDADAGWGQRPWLGFLFLLLGPVYIGFLLGHGLAMRDLSGGDGDLGQAWLLFTLLVVFACDTGAFAVGRLVGRHRMAPRISPNKTWEGAVGGLAASMGAALLVGLVFFTLSFFIRATAIALLRGVALVVLGMLFVTRVFDLTALSWLIGLGLPLLAIALPVVFQPELRRGLEQLGRAGIFSRGRGSSATFRHHIIDEISVAVDLLAERRHGGLIVLQRDSNLDEYVRTGIPLDSELSSQLLLTLFWPRTELHDGAVIVDKRGRIAAGHVGPVSREATEAEIRLLLAE